MNHIKLFEGYLDQPSYTEISGIDYARLLRKDNVSNLVSIDSKIEKSIKRRLNSEIKSQEIKSGRSSIKYYYPFSDDGNVHQQPRPQIMPIRGIQIAYPKDNWGTYIWEIEDEWFIVTAPSFFVELSGSTEYRGTHNKYYKCDGVDGLMELLKEIGIIE